MPEKFTYEINGKPYFQKPLVWGQIKQLKGIMPSLVIPTGVPLTQGLILALTDHLSILCAVILIPWGGNPKDKDIEALAQEFEFSLDLETAMQVVADFFECNPIASLAEKLGGIVKTMKERLTGTSTPSTKSSVSSPGETSPDGMPSSGDSLPTSQNPI